MNESNSRTKLLNTLAEEYELMYEALGKIEGQAVAGCMAEDKNELYKMLNNCFVIANNALDEIRERTA